MARIKISSGKAKGRRLQQLVACKIGEITGLPCGKDCDIESRPMGQTGPDVRLSPNARRLFNFSVECKNSETWGLPNTIEQARANCYPGTDWLVVLSKNRVKPIAVIDLDVFFALLAKAKIRGRQ